MMELSRRRWRASSALVIAVSSLQDNRGAGHHAVRGRAQLHRGFASCAPWPRRPRPGRSCRWFWAFFDLMGGGPCGRDGLCARVLASFRSSRLFMALNNDIVHAPVATMLASCSSSR